MDLSLVRTDPKAVTRMEIVKNIDGSLVTAVDLEKSHAADVGEVRWATRSGDGSTGTPSGSKVDAFLDRLGDMNAARWVDAREGGYGFDDFFLKLTLGSSQGEEIFIVGETIGAEQGEEHTGRYAQLADGRVFEIAQFYVDHMDVELDAFLDEEQEEVPEGD